MKTLLGFHLRRQLPLVIVAALLMAGLHLGAALLYDEGTVEAFSQARGQAPYLFSALGVLGSATLTQHLSSLLYGFLLPLMGGLVAAAIASRLIAGKLETGEMSHYLALPVRRGSLALTLWAVLMLSMVGLSILSAALGIAVSQLLRPTQLQIGWFLWLNLGLWLVYVLTGGLCFLLSCLSETQRSASRRAVLFFLFLLLLALLARPREMPAFLKYLSPYSAFDHAGLAVGRLAPEGLLMPLIGLLLSLAGLRAFTARELSL